MKSARCTEVAKRAEEMREVFGDILERIAQEEREAKAREDDGEVNQPLPSSCLPSTRGTKEMGREVEEEVVVEEGEVNSTQLPMHG